MIVIEGQHRIYEHSYTKFANMLHEIGFTAINFEYERDYYFDDSYPGGISGAVVNIPPYGVMSFGVKLHTEDALMRIERLLHNERLYLHRESCDVVPDTKTRDTIIIIKCRLERITPHSMGEIL